MDAERRNIAGGCHCGGIRYELSLPATATELPARSCSCSYCVRFAASWTSHSEADLKILFAARDIATRYRFGTATADFIHCSRCGVLCVAISCINGADYAVVNVNTFTAGEGFRLDRSESDFSGEETADRLERREQRWISTVDCQFAD